MIPCGSKNYTEFADELLIISNERDILDIIGLCGERNSQFLLVYEKNLSPDFFNLATGLAGVFFQKCVNYSVKVAFVIKFDNIKSERFKELIFESGKSRQIRFLKINNKPKNG